MTKLECKFDLSEDLVSSLNRLHDYIEATTGKAPDSKEMAKVLRRYFILSEIGAQIKWERENPDY